jgi:hypothetical protein
MRSNGQAFKAESRKGIAEIEGKATRVGASVASYLCFLLLNFSFFLLTFPRFEALRGDL